MIVNTQLDSSPTPPYAFIRTVLYDYVYNTNMYTLNKPKKNKKKKKNSKIIFNLTISSF